MKRFLLPFLALPLLALLCAWIGNALASPQRRLGWRARMISADAPAPVPVAPPLGTAAPIAAEPPAPQPRTILKTPPKAADRSPSPSPDRAKARFPWNPDHLEREISSDEALEAFKLGVPFFDARRSADFEAGHIPGAHSAPVWEDGLQERLAKLAALPAFQPRQARLAMPVVIYCSGGSCEDSHLLAEQMIPLAFGNLLIYQGGFPDWQRQGRSVARGPERP